MATYNMNSAGNNVVTAPGEYQVGDILRFNYCNGNAINWVAPFTGTLKIDVYGAKGGGVNGGGGGRVFYQNTITKDTVFSFSIPAQGYGGGNGGGKGIGGVIYVPSNGYDGFAGSAGTIVSIDNVVSLIAAAGGGAGGDGATAQNWLGGIGRGGNGGIGGPGGAGIKGKFGTNGIHYQQYNGPYTGGLGMGGDDLTGGYGGLASSAYNGTNGLQGQSKSIDGSSSGGGGGGSGGMQSNYNSVGGGGGGGGAGGVNYSSIVGSNLSNGINDSDGYILVTIISSDVSKFLIRDNYVLYTIADGILTTIRSDLNILPVTENDFLTLGGMDDLTTITDAHIDSLTNPEIILYKL